MSIKLMGTTERAKDYINKESNFVRGAFISCKKSDGVINIKASLYKKELVNGMFVFLFEYRLENGICREEIQKVIDEYIFIRIRKPNNKCISWTKKDMIGIINNKGEAL